MISPPLGLPEAALVSALRCGWGMAVASVAYRPVGWGSHHWEVTDAAGCRWFVTVDELAGKRLREGEPLAAGFGRLRASLAAARDLRGCGRRFVVASVPAGDGEPVVRVGDGFAVAVYPFIDGQSFAWGEFSSSAHRLGVLEMVAAVHTAPAGTCGQVMADDFVVPRRDELEAACDRAGDVADCGPYASAVSLVVRQNAVPIRRLLTVMTAW